jgi:putative inorganic carbon (HCO3(-)) transporter
MRFILAFALFDCIIPPMTPVENSVPTTASFETARWLPAQVAARYDARVIPLLFIPLALLLWLPLPWIGLGWLALPLYYALRWRALGSPFPQTRANVFVLLLLVGVVIGLMTSPARLDGIASAGKLLAGVTAFYVLLDGLKTPTAVWRTAAAFVLVGLGVVALLPFAVSWSADKIYALPSFLDWTLRPPGEGTNPNIVGGVLVAIFPVALALVLSRRRFEKIVGAVALGPFLLALMILQARGAWFALLGGLAVGAAVYRRWLVPALPLLILAALFANQQLGGASALSDVIFGKIGTVTGGTLQERVALWTQAVDLIRAHPLTGIGMGGYPYVAPYAPPYAPQAPGLIAPHAHNVFLQVALDTGILGLAGLVGMLALGFLSGWRAHRSGIAAPLPLAVLTALAVVVLHSLGESVFWGLKAQWLLWVLFGLALALDRLGRADAM